MKIIVVPGDGIGPEITQATLDILHTVSARFGLGLELLPGSAGHASLKQHGTTVAPGLLESVKAADGLLLGPMATYDFKDESQGEINPSRYFRKTLDLYANIRPVRTYEGMPAKSGHFDLVVVRENTEGFYADRNIESGSSEMLLTPDVAVSLRRITRHCCERIARMAFELAMKRRRQLTLVHKANVLKITDGLFVDICHEVGAAFPQVRVDEVIVDAMMAHVVRAPQQFDVVVTTNMFGDILSDLTAELSGSLGLGGSLNIGADYAMGQAVHGSAPDIAGKNRANPFSLLISAAMLLQWYSDRCDRPPFRQAGAAILDGIAQAIRLREVTPDLGGSLGTRETAHTLAQRLA